MPPGPVSNLRAIRVDETEVVLGWTAPGDDADEGQAATYDLRMATTLLHSGTFADAVPFAHGST